jgi:hypothetical protein
MTSERWMATCFACGSACFFVGPFPGYLQLVGSAVVGVTFFVGSIFFTLGGALQTAMAAGRAALWSAAIQSAGTLFFNFSTFRALHTAVSASDYDRLVWRPDALGSICFLVSGVIALWASRSGWQPWVNLAGCVFFGISAIAGYAVPSTGSILDLAGANWNTALGAACFFACAVATLRPRRAPASPAAQPQPRQERV